MLDASLRRVVDRPLALAAGRLVALGVHANGITVAGFGAGLMAAAAIATGHYWVGLGLVIANRLLDGLDGAVARLTRPTDLGAFLDIAFDFIFYASVPFAFYVRTQRLVRLAPFRIVLVPCPPGQGVETRTTGGIHPLAVSTLHADPLPELVSGLDMILGHERNSFPLAVGGK